MIKLLLILLLSFNIFSGPVPAPLEVAETDGNPSIKGVRKMIFTNGTVTNSGGGVASIAIVGEGGGILEEEDPIFTAWDKDYNDLINTPTIPTRDSLGLDTDDTVTFGNLSGTNTGDQTLYGNISITIDGGGSAITTGFKRYKQIPFNCTITRMTISGDVSGSIVVDIWKDVKANYPPTVADTIVASAKPTLSSAIMDTDETLTGWTTTLTKDDWIGVYVDSASTVTQVEILLEVTKT